MPRQAPPQPRPMNPKIWRACVGGAVQIPTVNSRVYYFPQGHINDASSPPQNLSPLLLSRPCIVATVSAVELLADVHTDEVFAKLVLNSAAVDTLPAVAVDEDDEIISFSKVLTPSDAHNGGGFSVPRSCADNIFPALNIREDRPVQTLRITDVHGKVWEFRHIFRGTPKRHLLTSGWGNFVDNKKLIAGDSVVFMKNSRAEMFIGIRRAARTAPPRFNKPTWLLETEAKKNKVDEKKTKKKEEKSKEGFSREGKGTGKFSPETVVEAAELAAQNKSFEVVYYPKKDVWSDFVVKMEVVDEAMKIGWSPGMRVKMSVDSEDSSRIKWYHGIVSSLSFPGSPWRMLQITWDEPAEVLKNSEWVSPWQVELVAPALHAVFPPTKKFRAADGSGMSTDGADPFSMTGFTNSTMEHFNQPLLSYGTSPPAGMQGARQNLFFTSSFSKFQGDNSHLCIGSSSGNNIVPSLKTLSTELNTGSSKSDNLSPNSCLCVGNSSGNNTLPSLKTLSTDLNIGSSKSDNSSPDSQSSVPSFGTELVQNHCCKSTKPGSVSFKLFGAVIETQQPVERCLRGTDCTGDHSSKSSNETEGTGNPLDDSPTRSELLDKHDGVGQ